MNKEKYELLKRMNSVGLSYIGTIVYDENTTTEKIKTIHDVFVETIEDSNGKKIQKFYNESGKFLGATGLDGKIYPAVAFSEQDFSFLSQLEKLSNNREISFDEYDKELANLAKELGMPKEKIADLTEIDLDQKIKEKDEEKDKISLDKEENQPSKEQDSKNKNALENINSKQKINMDILIDDRHSLADILGVQSGSKLIAVYSDAIADNKNTTKFSLIIQNPDGSLRPADMLEQTGGIDSDKTVYETNRDGSSVNQVAVKSSYKINTPSEASKEGNHTDRILNVRYGSMGYIEVDYGEMDPTNHKYAFTQKLETDRDYYTTKEVRDEFSGREDGIHNIEEDLDEIKMHEKAGCDDLTLKEADGDMKTGHFHDSAILEIKAYDPNIQKVFTDKEIEDRLHIMMDNHPNESFDEVVSKTQRDLSEDASHIRTRGEH